MNDPVESNSYAVAYRLLGVRQPALVVAATAADRLTHRLDTEGGLRIDDVPTEVWLPMLIDFTVEQSVRNDALQVSQRSDDEFAGLREALRRRLVRASRVERVVGALVHLCGYPVEQVAGMLRMDPQSVVSSARVLSPPPGIDYRDLGDPELIGRPSGHERNKVPVPYPSTIAVAAILLILILLATRCHGPRPALVEEGSFGDRQHTVEVQHDNTTSLYGG